MLTTHPLNAWIDLYPGISCRFIYNGHILGSTFIELRIGERIIVFSGDVGRVDDLLLRAPSKPRQADILLIESTYGNRTHPDDMETHLVEAICQAATRKGTVIIPGFAVERIQMLMFLIWKLNRQGKIPPLPVFMDSPMGRDVLQIFMENSEWHKVNPEQLQEVRKLIRVVGSVKETEAILNDPQAKIVIAGGGMASGGRVLSYFQKYLSDASSTVLLVGYQAEGTRGRQLLEGANEIKIYGEWYEVKARIRNVEGLSAHADRNGLTGWMSELEAPPRQIFLVHGEAAGSKGLQEAIKSVYGWTSTIPRQNETYVLFNT
jgi:metallo-beta-lactamase family protein